ncbi:hypothetical protein [Streptomyces sp. AM 3-1-1]|uniref:hypothetical protein n=1 Tax=unclassified Streptomyces TaxID=2593676 RepID=UPI0023B8E3A0|nr:hypothetical protein [Streptomyces sp. AM 3-1-1]WEH28513.1 hypothetical protein P0D76_14845 [Streptomyces sp. AM 3-1-1]
MTDPISLTIATLLAGGYLTEAGSGAWRTTTRIVAFLRNKFGQDQQALDALQRCEDDPSSASAQADVRSALDRYLDTDPDFRSELLSVLESQGCSQKEVLNNQVTVTDQANVGKIVTIKDVQGDVSF